jgi:hypothetical protein
MQTRQHFSPDILTLLDRTDEVQIEARSPDGQRAQPVTIWVVVADGQDVYARSSRGPRGRWYQALTQHPQGALHADGREILFRAVHVDDPESVSRVSDAYRRKYEQRWPKETAPMVGGDVLSTTLRLEPLTT